MDLVLVAVEASLWTAEQFVEDLKVTDQPYRSLPCTCMHTAAACGLPVIKEICMLPNPAWSSQVTLEPVFPRHLPRL